MCAVYTILLSFFLGPWPKYTDHDQYYYTSMQCGLKLFFLLPHESKKLRKTNRVHSKKDQSAILISSVISDFPNFKHLVYILDRVVFQI